MSRVDLSVDAKAKRTAMTKHSSRRVMALRRLTLGIVRQPLYRAVAVWRALQMCVGRKAQA